MSTTQSLPLGANSKDPEFQTKIIFQISICLKQNLFYTKVIVSAFTVTFSVSMAFGFPFMLMLSPFIKFIKVKRICQNDLNPSLVYQVNSMYGNIGNYLKVFKHSFINHKNSQAHISQRQATTFSSMSTITANLIF